MDIDYSFMIWLSSYWTMYVNPSIGYMVDYAKHQVISKIKF